MDSNQWKRERDKEAHKDRGASTKYTSTFVKRQRNRKEVNLTMVSEIDSVSRRCLKDEGEAARSISMERLEGDLVASNESVREGVYSDFSGTAQVQRPRNFILI